MKFDKKSVIVTGAGAGMGREITLAFLKENATVVAVDLKEEVLEDLKKEAAELPGTLLTCVGDISKEETSEKMAAAALEAAGRLDILVNNAGIGGHCEPVGETENEAWDRIIAVNLTGPMYAMRKAVQVMGAQENGGSIITIASVAGIRGCRACAAYTAAKHGLVGLCRHTAFTYMHEGIRSNIICPGAIRTNMSGDHGHDSEFGRERILAGMDPVIPMGHTEDIASAVLFLAGEEAKFINGATLVVDGGVSCN